MVAYANDMKRQILEHTKRYTSPGEVTIRIPPERPSVILRISEPAEPELDLPPTRVEFEAISTARSGPSHREGDPLSLEGALAMGSFQESAKRKPPDVRRGA
jgi:hypothetical protein